MHPEQSGSPLSCYDGGQCKLVSKAALIQLPLLVQVVSQITEDLIYVNGIVSYRSYLTRLIKCWRSREFRSQARLQD